MKSRKTKPGNHTRNKQPAPSLVAGSKGPQQALQRAIAQPHLATPADILTLQRTVGNRAVRQLLQRRQALPKATPPQFAPAKPVRPRLDSRPVVQREWIDAEDASDPDVWLGDIPGRPEEQWRLEWQSDPFEYWYTVPEKHKLRPLHVRQAGEENAKTKAEWIKAGFGDVMKHIDANLPKNRRQSESIAIEYGMGKDMRAGLSVNGSEPSKGKKAAYLGKEQLKIKKSAVKRARMELNNVDWRRYKATSLDFKKWANVKKYYSSESASDVKDTKLGKMMEYDELHAISHHIGGGFMSTNPRIGEYGSSSLNAMDIYYVRMLASGLNKLPGYKGKVYRGYSNDIDQYYHFKPGNIYTEKSVMSTSRKASRSLGFGRATFFVIKAIGGGKHVKELQTGDQKDEDEVLYPPRTDFKITKTAGVRNPHKHEDVLAGNVPDNQLTFYTAKQRQQKGIHGHQGNIIYMNEVPATLGFKAKDFQGARSDLIEQALSPQGKAAMLKNAKLLEMGQQGMKLEKKLKKRPAEKPLQALDPSSVAYKSQKMGPKIEQLPAERPLQALDPQSVAYKSQKMGPKIEQLPAERPLQALDPQSVAYKSQKMGPKIASRPDALPDKYQVDAQQQKLQKAHQVAAIQAAIPDIAVLEKCYQFCIENSKLNKKAMRDGLIMVATQNGCNIKLGPANRLLNILLK